MRKLFVICTLLAVTGCDRIGTGPYQIVHAGSQTFLLNTGNGTLSIVEGNAILPTAAVATKGAPTTVKVWPVQRLPQLGNITVTARTIYRDGQMKYVIQAAPYAGAIERELTNIYSLARLNIDFDDSDGFRATSIVATIRGDTAATRLVDEKGVGYAVQWRGDIPMSREAYDALGTFSVGWSGFQKQPSEDPPKPKVDN